MLREMQGALARYVLTREPDSRDAGAFLARPGAMTEEIAAADRLSIHRNNVMGSLVEVLADTFPAVARQCGEGNFEAAAAAFVRAAPPDRAQLSHYGAGFADFLAGFEPARRDLPFLPDLARLEWAMNEAYFAAEAFPLDADGLGALPPERLGDLRLAPHPATRLVEAEWPVYRLWREGSDDASLPGDGRFVLVVRPEAVVEVLPIGAGDRALVATLSAGGTLGEAVEAGVAAGVAADEEFDVQTALGGHLVHGTFCRATLSPGEDSSAA